ncbi:unnamed protein product [Cylindrotheca closterium]|uniref:YCII-related domain-containing protein n=1 Tax=Cylindrotheca closterium TaxID=2856 RepID=A0AAD2CRL9_9STRA|nr:unnamed protein product [Cylindrotheca closterium]
MMQQTLLLSIILCVVGTEAFSVPSMTKTSLKQYNPQHHQQSSTLFMSSFSADGSEYASTDKDYVDDDIVEKEKFGPSFEDDVSSDVVEEKPVPMSKNAGNRFVAVVWDAEVDSEGRDSMELHEDRDACVEDHVLFCRKRNLYNETFNTNSMVDILRSLPLLSADLQRIVGHAMILESPDICHVKEMLAEEPFLKALNGGDWSKINLFRWRHIRDYTLRRDDGRLGYPCMMFGIDHDPETDNDSKQIREETKDAFMEYLIKSERIIMAGPLHMPTEIKDDPSSIATGDFILFNAKSREDAIQFVEEMPTSAEGLYKDLRVHFYNTLDITGKFISEDPMRDAPNYQMKEAMKEWGYPVEDNETRWLNW